MRDALNAMRARNPDVIVSDIAMPEVDGYDFIRTIRGLAAREGAEIQSSRSLLTRVSRIKTVRLSSASISICPNQWIRLIWFEQLLGRKSRLRKMQFSSKVRATSESGELDSFNPNADGSIDVIVVQPNGQILIGGAFDATNFRADVNASGSINAGDVALIGAGLP